MTSVLSEINMLKVEITAKQLRLNHVLMYSMSLLLSTLINIILDYTTLTNFSTKYLVMCKVYTDVGGIK